MKHNAREGRVRRLGQCVARTFLAIALVASSVPILPRHAVAGEDTADARIANMLATGEFVEGEVVAIVRQGAEVEVAAQAEELAKVEASTVEETVQACAAESVVNGEAVLLSQASGDERLDVRLVVDHGRTTEQILRDLYADPNVVCAEPNYITTATEAFGESRVADSQSDAVMEIGADASSALWQRATENAADIEVVTQEESRHVNTENPGDLTFTQWAMDKSLSTNENAITPISPVAGYGMNVPGWAEGRNNPDAQANASGTVCVMDEAVDITNPDLADLIYRFTPEQQAKYGCSEYGYNASGDEYGTNYLHPCGEHGTHVAGIVAAQWNGRGISGVAHGVKIITVSVFGARGQDMVLSSVVRGFQFLADISGEANLKAINCSWGTKQPQFALTVMINELGKKGVNTTIASGNECRNMDENIDVSGQMASSPYTVIVNSAMPNGKSSEFSNYGQMSTDLFAPGSHMMSTVASQVTSWVDSRTYEGSGYARRVHYFPQATTEENRISYEDFAGGLSGVRVYRDNPALNANAKELTSTVQVSDMGFGDRCSLAVNLNSLDRETLDTKNARGITAMNGYVYLAVPVASADAARSVKWANVDVAMSDAFKPIGALDTLTCADSDGKPVEVDAAASQMLDLSEKVSIDNEYKGWAASSANHIYQTQWMGLSYNVDGFVGACNRAHERMQDGEEFIRESEEATARLRDLGTVEDVYAWQPDGDDGQTYVIEKNLRRRYGLQ